MIRRSSVSKAWAVALSAVRVQRKLAHNKDLAVHILERAVRLSVLILKNAELADLVRSRHPCRRRREGSGIPVRWIPSPVRPHGPTRVLLSVIRLSCFLRRSACTPFSVPADPPTNFIFSLLEFPVLTRAETAYVGPFPASSSCLFSAFSRSRRFSSSTRRSSSSTAMIAWFKENIFMSSISTISAQDFNSRSR